MTAQSKVGCVQARTRITGPLFRFTPHPGEQSDQRGNRQRSATGDIPSLVAILCGRSVCSCRAMGIASTRGPEQWRGVSSNRDYVRVACHPLGRLRFEVTGQDNPACFTDALLPDVANRCNNLPCHAIWVAWNRDCGTTRNRINALRWGHFLRDFLFTTICSWVAPVIVARSVV